MTDTQEQQALTVANGQGDGALTRPEPQLPAVHVQEMLQQVQAIQQIMDRIMQEDTHYGTIPGTNKPTLYKPGAEKLSMAFRFAPEYDITRNDFEDGHREYEVTCRLIHIPTGQFYGSGVGCCSTLESKYRYRKIDEATDVEVPKSFWDSGDDMKSRDGKILRNALDVAGVKAPDDADVWVTKEKGTWYVSIKAKGENPDIADVYNTVRKIAKKRAHVDAVLTATAASDIFTQDLEDMNSADISAQTVVGGQAARKPAAQQQPSQQKQAPGQQRQPQQETVQTEAERNAKFNKLIDEMVELLTGCIDDQTRGEKLAEVAEYIRGWPLPQRKKAVKTLVGEELVFPPNHDRATEAGSKIYFMDTDF